MNEDNYRTGAGYGMPDEEMEENRPHGRKRKKISGKKRLMRGILILILTVAVLVLGMFLLFQTRKIEIKGNQYCPDAELASWIKQDKMAINTLFLWFKYNYTEVEKPAAIQSVKVSVRNPWTVRMTVEEKNFLGYFEYEDEFLYFDEEGTAALKSPDIIEGAPFIEGLEIKSSKVKMNQKLPVTEEGIFDKIVEVTRLLNKYELSSDKLSVEQGKKISLFFGNVTVQLGSGDYEVKVAQIPPILEKLEELYPGQAGVLHLETYDPSDSAIRFVPDTAEEAASQTGEDENAPDKTQESENTGEDPAEPGENES